MFFNLIISHFYKIDSSSTEHDVDLKNDKLKMISTCLNLSPHSGWIPILSLLAAIILVTPN